MKTNFINRSRIQIILFLLLFSNWSIAQTNNSLKSSSSENRSNEKSQVEEISQKKNSQGWYSSQADSWDAELETSATNANAWFNYYKAQRFASYSSNSKNIITAKQSLLDEIVIEMEEAIPYSFEYNYIKYWNGNNDTSLFPFLQKAYQIAPQRNETYTDFVTYYELTDSIQKKIHFCRKLKNSQVYQEHLYNYAFNVLQSVEQNGILFSYGEWDTYPLWILQLINRFRDDIQIINLDLFEKRYYFNKIVKRLNLKGADYQQYITNRQLFFRTIAAANPEQGFYLGLTVEKSLIIELSDVLFSTGLAMKVSLSDFDNVKTVLENWDKFHIDYLINEWGQINQGTNIARLNLNYIAPMLLVYQDKIKNNKQKEADSIKELMLNLADKAGEKSRVEQLFSQ